MDSLERIETALAKMAEVTTARLGSIDVTMAKQGASLEEHIRRTGLLESAHAEIRAELRPLTRAHFMWSGVGKAIAMAATIGGVATGLLRFMGKI